MRALLLAALLVSLPLLAASSARADDPRVCVNAFACAGGITSGSADCANAGDHGYHLDSVYAHAGLLGVYLGGAYVHGQRLCYRGAESHYDLQQVGAGAYAPLMLAEVAVRWKQTTDDNGTTCETYVAKPGDREVLGISDDVRVDAGCPLGPPPALAWGRLLP